MSHSFLFRSLFFPIPFLFLLMLAPFVDGQETLTRGVLREYYDNGRVRVENYVNDDQVVYQKMYSPDGRLVMEIFLKDDKVLSMRHLYRDGALKMEVDAVKGVTKLFYRDGSLKAEQYKGRGIVRYYYPNGALMEQTITKGDRLVTKTYSIEGYLTDIDVKLK